jgi:hypothetical protein
LNGDKSLDLTNQDVLDIQEESEKLQQEESIFCTVKPDEVPPVPENKFLMRGDAILTSNNASTADLKQASHLPNDSSQDNRERRNRDVERR